MKDGGFDVIIGNPPYVRQETLGEEFKAYAKQNFETYAGTADLYIYFIEQAHKLLKYGGYFGMIVSNKWMRSNYGKALREFLKRESQLVEIVDFGELPVFGEVLAYPVIIISQREKTQKQYFNYSPIKSLDFDSLVEEVKSSVVNLDERAIEGDIWSLTTSNSKDILDKLWQKSVPLGEFVKNHIYYGIKTGYNEAFVIPRDMRDRLVDSDPKSAEIIKPFLMGRDVHEYRIDYYNRYLIFTRRGIDIKNYTAVHKFLKQFKERLTPKPRDWKGENWNGRKPGPYQWYEIQDSVDYYAEFEKPKIILPSIVQKATFAYDSEGLYSNDKTTIIPTDNLYLLAVLNSKISDYFLRQIASTKQGGYFEQKPMYISQLPIRRIDFENPAEKSAHDEIVKLVEKMLALQKERQSVRREDDLDRVRNLERQIAQVDEEINQKVYALYGLTEDEIKIVEGG